MIGFWHCRYRSPKPRCRASEQPSLGGESNAPRNRQGGSPMRRMVVLSALVILVLMGAPRVFAHHPFSSEFDRNKPVTVTGTVASFEWRDPHSGIRVDGRDAN